MKVKSLTFKHFVGALLVSALVSSCAGGSGSGVAGNQGGSQPINEQETQQYKAHLLKCYKTGGSRVVKIEGVLRCY